MKEFKKVIFSIFIWLFLLFVFCPVITHADASATAAATSTSLQDPLKGVTVAGFIGRVINGAMGILGAVALFVMIVGGFQWLTSGGNEEKIKKGTQAMLWAVIGIAIALSSYVFVKTWLDVLAP